LVVEVLSPLYKRVFPGWIENLKGELASCDTVLDLGCGYNSLIQYCNVPFSVGVELFEPYLEESKKKHIHDQYIKADIRKVEFKPKSLDAILCLEVLEHLTKEEGNELIKRMEKWAKKKIIITTPNGYLWQDGYESNPLQEHKSGWNSVELKGLGFKVRGMNGWKKLRAYKGSIIYKPAFLWARISDLTQKIAYRHPKLAFQLFAVKEIDSGRRRHPKSPS
jgi:SAM-dependent methyltransferase